MLSTHKTTNIVIAALGGEGGGTLVSWIEDVAHNAGWYTQATSIAGVAQRTGATIYYIELFPGRSENQTDRAPIMSMFPAPGDIDIAISSEIAEAGRLIQRGFCSKDRTTLIASDHHIFGITEKVSLGDGRADTQQIAKVAAQQCKKLVSFDMRELAEQNNTVISATLFGALAGSKALPFSKSEYESVISAGGKMVENNIAAFSASYNKAIAPALSVENSSPLPKLKSTPEIAEAIVGPKIEPFVLPCATTKHGAQLLSRIKTDVPASCHEFLTLGVEKLLDYQDADYANLYLDHLDSIVALDSGEQDHILTNETARYLALWMSYEDTARVAQIKTRAARQEKIRQEVNADQEQIFHVTEFFAPRLEELCQPLPAGLARRIIASPLCGRLSQRLTKGRKLRTDTILSFSLLRMMAFTAKWRRSSYTYAHEHQQINAWLTRVKEFALNDSEAALAIVECASLVKGYGKTRERGSQQIDQILSLLSERTLSATQIHSLKDAALLDDQNSAFEQELAQNVSSSSF